MPQHGKKSKRREKAVLVAKMRGISGDFRRHGLNQPHVILDRKSRRLANLRKRDAEDRAGLLRDDRASAECRESVRQLMLSARDDPSFHLEEALVKLCDNFAVPVLAAALGKDVDEFKRRFADAETSVAADAAASDAYLEETCLRQVGGRQKEK